MVYPNAARAALEEGLSEEDFFIDVNRRVYSAISSLYHEGTPIDITTVSTRLKDTNQLELVGGYDYLTRLTDASVTSANTRNYVQIIHDKAIMRKLIEAAQTIVEEGYDGQPDINEYLDGAEKAVTDISRNRRTSEFRDPAELMTNVVDNIRKMADNKSDVTGIKTGYEQLDHTTHGFQRGDLIILAARPSMGKTAVSLNLALNAARYQPDQAVAIFSLEMSAEQLAMRLLSARSRVPGDKLKTGYLTSDEWNKVNETANIMKTLNIYIDDTPGTKVPEIFSKCRRLQQQHNGIALIVIDYIQLISGSGSGHGDYNRQQEVSDISRSLKALARELKVPVMALSQLSRSVESRDSKKPMLSDLRESGAIEQDADIVMMLYRDSYYNEEAKAAADASGTEEIEINIAKHRNGATRRISVAFEAATNAIMDIDRSNGPANGQ